MKRKSKLSQLSRENAYECYQYAFNSLFLGPRFAEHLVDFAKGLSNDLRTFAEEHARNMLKQGKFERERDKP